MRNKGNLGGIQSTVSDFGEMETIPQIHTTEKLAASPYDSVGAQLLCVRGARASEQGRGE